TRGCVLLDIRSLIALLRLCCRPAKRKPSARDPERSAVRQQHRDSYPLSERGLSAALNEVSPQIIERAPAPPEGDCTMSETIGRLLAAGKLGEVFEWSARVVKLYRSSARIAMVFREAAIHAALEAMALPVPAVWGVLEVGGAGVSYSTV